MKYVDEVLVSSETSETHTVDGDPKADALQTLITSAATQSQVLENL